MLKSASFLDRSQAQAGIADDDDATDGKRRRSDEAPSS
jgi:hypothetical protein